MLLKLCDVSDILELCFGEAGGSFSSKPTEDIPCFVFPTYFDKPARRLGHDPDHDQEEDERDDLESDRELNMVLG